MVSREPEIKGPNPSPEGPFQPDLSVEVASIRMKTPVMTASGTFGYGKEFEGYLDPNRLGAIVVKTITVKPRPGNPPPRVVETPAGMLNAIGLQNVGLEAFLREYLPYLRQFSPPLIVNIAGGAIEEYEVLASQLSQVEGVAGIELNVSCPNLADGLVFGTDPHLLSFLVKRVRQVTRLPLLVKLTPNVTDIVLMARSAVEAGADGLSLINTLLGMAIDIETRRPKLANDGRAFGPRHQAGGPPYGLPGGAGGEGAHRRDRWNHGRGGCPGVSDRGGPGGGRRYRKFCRSRLLCPDP